MTRRSHGHGISLRGWLAVAALAGFSVNAHAKAPSEYDAWRWMGSPGGNHTVSFGSNGTPLVSKPVATGPLQAGNMNFARPSAAGQWPTLQGKADLPLPGGAGRTLPLTMNTPINKAAAGKALAKFAAKAIFPISAGMALYDFLSETGYQVAPDNNGDGSNEIYKKTFSNCNAGGTTCYEWRLLTGSDTSYSTNPTAAAQKLVGQFHSECGGNVISVSNITVHPTAGFPSYRYNFTCANGQTKGPANLGDRTTTQSDSSVTQVTEEQMANDIASKSGWPTNSKVTDAIAQAANEGYLFPPDEDIFGNTYLPTVTGPATVTGQTTTTTNTDGSTIQEKTDYDVQYWDLGKVKITEKKTTTTTKPTSEGGTTTQTSTQLKELEKEKTETEKTCESDPTAPACWKLDTPTAENIPKKDITVTYGAQNLGLGNGSCPAPIGWNDSLGSHTVDLAPYCNVISTLVKPLVLAFAVLSAFFIIGGFKTGD